MDVSELQVMLNEWQGQQFPNLSIHGAIEHLKEEVQEIDKAIEDESICEEAADIIMIALSIFGQCGMDAQKVILKKHEVNQEREWEDVGGHYRHVKD